MIQPFFRRRDTDFIGTRRADEPLLPECRCFAPAPGNPTPI
jgi:hypothetical protein